MDVKRLLFVGSAQGDLRKFPRPARVTVGFALWEAQHGRESREAKPLKGFGGRATLEVVARHDGDTYRAVYTVKFAGIVYVLHAFQKKSKKGIETPRHEMETVRRRLRTAEEDYARRQKDTG